MMNFEQKNIFFFMSMNCKVSCNNVTTAFGANISKSRRPETQSVTYKVSIY